MLSFFLPFRSHTWGRCTAQSSAACKHQFISRPCFYSPSAPCTAILNPNIPTFFSDQNAALIQDVFKNRLSGLLKLNWVLKTCSHADGNFKDRIRFVDVRFVIFGVDLLHVVQFRLFRQKSDVTPAVWTQRRCERARSIWSSFLPVSLLFSLCLF